MNEAPLVCVRGLTKTFGEGEGAATVLHGIDIALAQGELAALLGPSGSGKSTLLTILGTLLRPTGGEHTMLGHDLADVYDWWGREPAPGMHRAAVEAGVAAPWIAANLESIELIERKIYNRHRFGENLALALRFPEPIRVRPSD